MASFPPQYEKAEVSIEGSNFSAWESIRVRSDFEEPPPFFTLTTAESVPGAKTQSALRIRPGDECTIKLAGEKVLTGYVNTRQASYDAMRHGVMVQGRSKTQDCIDCKMELKKIDGGNFKQKTLQQIGSKVLEPFTIRLNVKGGDKPFEDVQAMPGESPYNLIERLSRMHGFYLFHDGDGNLIASKDPLGTMGNLIEGKNIKSCRATIQDPSLFSTSTSIGQQNGKDDRFGYKASQVKGEAKNEDVKRYRPYVLHCEKNCTKEDAQARIDFENTWGKVVTYDVEIVVYGWLTEGKSGQIWKPGWWTQMKSPMAMISDKLWIRSATFTQDNQSGTLTTLELRRDPQSKQTSIGGAPASNGGAGAGAPASSGGGTGNLPAAS
jgi:prophage tail gpP-like protein